MNQDGIALFDNRDNRKNEKQPVMKGYVTLNGEQYEVALWSKESKKTGKRYWGGTIKERVERSHPNARQEAPSDDPDDSIPF